MLEGRGAGATEHAEHLERSLDQHGMAGGDGGRWWKKGRQRILVLPGESVLLETLRHTRTVKSRSGVFFPLNLKGMQKPISREA